MAQKSTTMELHYPRDGSRKCHLLDIPGELRNHIYDFAREEDPVIYRPRGRAQKHESEGLGPRYFALTQVCRQLRAVYSPIYAATTVILVSHHDLAGFARDKAHLACDGEENVIGNVVVNWASKMSFEDYGDDECEVDHETYDILPLVMLCAQNPGLRVKCTPEVCSCISTSHGGWASDRRVCVRSWLDILLTCGKSSKLQAWLEDSVSSVNLVYNLDLEFSIRDGMGKWWMVSWYDTPEIWSCPDFLAWTTDTGFDLSRPEARAPWHFKLTMNDDDKVLPMHLEVTEDRMLSEYRVRAAERKLAQEAREASNAQT